MTMKRRAQARKFDLSAFRSDERGVSAVEFALILPLMLGMYLGVSEVAHGVAINRKVALTARAVADLTSQAPGTISNAEMSNILDAAAAVMAPYPTGPLKVTVTALNTGTNKRTIIAWSDTRGGEARVAGQALGIPIDHVLPNTQLIMTDVTYDYTPTIGYMLTGTLRLGDRLYMAARVNTITRVP